MIHFFKSIFTPPSSPFLTSFERFKPLLVHFLGGYILSSESMWKGGRLSETKVSETLKCSITSMFILLEGQVVCNLFLSGCGCITMWVHYKGEDHIG